MAEPSPTQVHNYRPPDINRLRRLSEYTGIEVADTAARVEAFKSADPIAFIDTLAVVNGLLQGEERFTRWDKPVVSNVSFGTMAPDLQPPENPTEKFIELFKDIQSNITNTEESIDTAAVRLYFGIVGVHMFKDANGRTARTAFQLLRHGSLPEDDATVLERSKTGIMCEAVNAEAITSMLANEGLPKDRVFERDFIADTNQDKIVANYGMTQHLRYIAVRRLQAQEDPATLDNAHPPAVITLDTQSSFVRQGFNEEYGYVRDEWFERFTSIPTRYLDYCIKQLEPAPIDVEVAAE